MSEKGQEKVNQSTTTTLTEGNKALRSGDLPTAMSAYVIALRENGALANTVVFNIQLTRRRYRAQKNKGLRLYAEKTESALIAATENNTCGQVADWVAAHPCDKVCLAHDRGPSLLFGLLYKLIWGTELVIGNEARWIDNVFINALKKALGIEITDTLPFWLKKLHEQRETTVEKKSTVASIRQEDLPHPYSTFARKIWQLSQGETSSVLAPALEKTTDCLAALAQGYPIPAEQPLVSVIMPTFNRAAIIADSIATVVEQHYHHWELLVCDDGSTDATAEIVVGFKDARIRYFKQPNRGAAAARNTGLEHARGEFIAYLDSDNYWHPEFLMATLTALHQNSGHSAVYTDFIDLQVRQNGRSTINSVTRPAFHHENLLKKPFIDLNSFVHRRELLDSFGGFNPALKRRQDYDLILKYTWLRDPLHLTYVLTLYQRNDALAQITKMQKGDTTCIEIIDSAVKGYLQAGLPVRNKPPVRKVTIISWDLCRNHFSKPFALAEALSHDYSVQLVAFKFFDEPIFPPLEGVQPNFETVYLPGAEFPDFFTSMQQAVEAINGDVVYVVKPRLPSLGVALLAHYYKRIPIILEINDLETVVSSPKHGDQHREVPLDTDILSDSALINPYSDLWSQIMDPLAKQLPVLVTHNRNIDAHFANSCLYMRNLKDESVYDPARFSRIDVRAELGFTPEDRVILFGGLIRKHKGIYELVELIERLADSRYKLLFVGSRTTPDQKQLIKKFGKRVRVLPPQDREAMAKINGAADLVILWLDPEVPASHYQMPYKATDALAMQTPIIANDISDLGVLGRQGYLRLVEFGDWEGMLTTIQDIFAHPQKTQSMCEAARRLYLRQFSYAAARSNFALAAGRAAGDEAKSATWLVAELFTKQFTRFYQKLSQVDQPFLAVNLPAQVSHVQATSVVVDPE